MIGKLDNLLMQRKLYLKICIGILSCIMYAYLFLYLDGALAKKIKDTYLVSPRSHKSGVISRQDGQNDEKKEIMMDLFTRLSLINYHCTIYGTRNTGDIPELYVSKSSQLRYCKVPKAGSTFWMEVFLILNKFSNASQTFGGQRVNLHFKTKDLVRRKTNIFEISKKDKIILVTRDPFSRIYSAFIDKIYLPGLWTVYSSIAKDKRDICYKSNTFDVFLDFIIRTRAKGRKLDEHWVPITEHCAICRIPYNFILKQETFYRDVAYVLNNSNMDDQVREDLLHGVGKKHVEYSIQEIVKEQTDFGRRMPCLSFLDFCRRLWVSFQIQGHISDRVAFPKSKFIGLNFRSVDQLRDVYLGGVRAYNMTSAEKHLQRNQHLRKAYKGIGAHLLRKIVHLYRYDFAFFNYTTTPPHLRP